jgi:hypothetical protein
MLKDGPPFYGNIGNTYAPTKPHGTMYVYLLYYRRFVDRLGLTILVGKLEHRRMTSDEHTKPPEGLD